jgi:hypothetical protein
MRRLATTTILLCAAPSLAQSTQPDELPPLWDGKASATAGPQQDQPVPWALENAANGHNHAKADLPDAWAVPEASKVGSVAGADGKLEAPLADGAASIAGAGSLLGLLDHATLEKVRQRLRSHGLLANADDSENGLTEAIRRFQASIKMPETGSLDRVTLGQLLVS